MLSAPKLGAPSTARSGWPKSWGLWYPRTPHLRSDPETLHGSVWQAEHSPWGLSIRPSQGLSSRGGYRNPAHVHFACLRHDRKIRASGKALETWTQETYKIECPECICYGPKLVPRDLAKPKPQWLRTCPRVETGSLRTSFVGTRVIRVGPDLKGLVSSGEDGQVRRPLGEAP